MDGRAAAAVGRQLSHVLFGGRPADGGRWTVACPRPNGVTGGMRGAYVWVLLRYRTTRAGPSSALRASAPNAGLGKRERGAGRWSRGCLPCRMEGAPWMLARPLQCFRVPFGCRSAGYVLEVHVLRFSAEALLRSSGRSEGNPLVVRMCSGWRRFAPPVPPRDRKRSRAFFHL